MTGEREWQRIDELWMAGRGNLTEDDLCFFYFVRDDRGFSASHDNDVMCNFKHDPVRYPPGTRANDYKMRAIEECAGHIASFLNTNRDAFQGLDVVLVPMPTSQPRGSELFDGRIDIACKKARCLAPWVKVCKALDVSSSLEKSHLGGTRDVDLLSKSISCLPIPSSVVPTLAILVDDVLTTGAHYAACKRVMRAVNPEVDTMGLFLSIHVRENDYGYEI